MAALLELLRSLKRLADQRLGVLSRFVQFCFVGASGMVVDLSVYWGLLKLALALPIARAIAIWIAMTWNYMLNRRLTFSYSRHEGILLQYLRFAGACAVGAVISWSIAVGLVYFSFFAQHVFIAAIIGIVVGTISNFLISLLWVFHRKRDVPGANNEREACQI
jgi:dolichol-phosphate mannosyltransferase